MTDAYKLNGKPWASRIVGHDTVQPDQLLANPMNARIHGKLQQDATAGNLDALGFVKSVVVNRVTGHVVDGHLRVTLALRNGSPVPVEYVDLTEAEETQALATLDPLTELATYDAELLTALLAEVNTDDTALQEMLAKMAEDAGIAAKGEPVDAEPQVNRAEELRQLWDVQPGQLWLLDSGKGRPHRLICGDCTDPATVARVMGGEKIRMVWTDPPYGVAYQTKLSAEEAVARHRRRDGLEVENDNLTETQTEEMIRGALTNASAFSIEGATVYVASPPGTLLPYFVAAFSCSGFNFRHSLVWIKNRFVMGRADYHYRHELILYGWKDGAHFFVDDRTLDSVFEIDRPSVSEMHPTMKPVELVSAMIQNSSKVNEIVYDPFAGSGTTLIACESLSRQCRAVEISPGYVAVCLQRWADATTCTPVLLES